MPVAEFVTSKSRFAQPDLLSQLLLGSMAPVPQLPHAHSDLFTVYFLWSHCRWELVEKTSVEELEERDVPDSVLRVIDFIASQPRQWQGTASRLIEESGVEVVSVAVFGKCLAQHKGFLKNAESNTNGVACVKAAFWS